MYIKQKHKPQPTQWLTTTLVGLCIVFALLFFGFLYWLVQNYDFELNQTVSYLLRFTLFGGIGSFITLALYKTGSASRRKFILFVITNILIISFATVALQGALFRLFLIWPLTLSVVIFYFSKHPQINKILAIIGFNSLILLALVSPFLLRGTSEALLEAFIFPNEIYLLLSSTAIVTTIALLHQKYAVTIPPLNTFRPLLANVVLMLFTVLSLVWCILNASPTAISNIIPILILITIAFTVNNYSYLVIDKQVPDNYFAQRKVPYIGLVMFMILVLRLLFLKWDSGYGNFHSGESIFFNLIQSFGAGNFSVLEIKSQSIMVLLFGYFESLFRDLSIASKINLRLVMNLISFANVYLVFKITQLLFAQHERKNTIALIAMLFLGLNYFFIFYSNLIRPDTLIALIYNLFFYFILKNRSINFVLLSIIAGVGLAFKGNGLLLVVLTMAMFVMMKYQPDKNLYHMVKSIAKPRVLFSLVLIFGLTISTFYLLTPYAHGNIMDSFFTIQRGLERFGIGHYGLFPTNISVLETYLSRSALLFWAFSPIIFLFPIGVCVFLYQINPIKRFYSLNKQELVYIFITLATVVFFLFIFRKPIQFARYYFPFITLFFIYASYALIHIPKKKIILTIVTLYAVFNMSFYWHMFYNSRIEANKMLASLPDEEIYISKLDKGWKLPPRPKDKTYIKVASLSEVPPGKYLLITGQSYFLYGNYVLNKEKYKPSDWYPSREPDEDTLSLYSQIVQMEPVLKVSKKNFFFFDNSQLPYDTWYMTHPDYYMYRL